MGIVRALILGSMLLGLFAHSKDVPDQATNFKLTAAFPSLAFDMPVELVSPPNSDLIFVVEQKGRIMVFPNKGDVREARVFLDIEKKVDSGGEKGLLGLAFHPEFSSNGYFYVNYTRSRPLQTVVSRFTASNSNALVADPKSEKILFHFDQPYSNHNGGKVAFGNDGMLYIATGDGGSGGDPHNNGQNLSSWLGKILRINVDESSADKPYSIPVDNPFKNNKQGYLEEIYAYGLRNVWRFNFDHESGALWAGDVGQNKIEEIDIIIKGGNYGWREMEADECFKSRNCEKNKYLPPVFSYYQGSDTGRSITGGYVCYDPDLASLRKKYVYGDFVTGNIWALTYNGKTVTGNDRIARLTDGLSSFGEDSHKNLYVLAYGTGKIYHIEEQ